MQKSRTKKLCMCALFAALTAVLSQIAIPIGAVPINLATFSVFMAGLLLGAKYAAVSQCVYVLIGAVGVPVFSAFRGGVGVLFGPTGGYIFGYVIAAWITGFIAERAADRTVFRVLALLAGFFAYMIPGVLWIMFSAKISLIAAVTAYVVPFIPGDALKMCLAAILSRHLKSVLV